MKMKTVMALAMALSMIAVTGAVTYWDGVEDSSAVDANGVTISGNQIFANGIPIKIVEDEEGKTVIKSGTWNGDSPGDVWTNVDTGTLNLSACTVFGGSLNGNVDKTYIQMDGGKIGNIAGGGKTDSAVKYTTQSATIIINGGTVGYVAGGGYAPTDGEIGSGYVTDTTEKMSNVTAEATITMNGGTVSALIGGGYRSYAYVGETTIEFTNGTVGELIAGGMNGYTGKSTVTIDGGVVKNGGYGSKGLITSANRGEVKDVSITVKDLGAGSDAYFAIGALSWATSSDGGCNAVITGNLNVDIQDGEGLTVYAGIFQNRIGGDQSAAVNSSPWTDKTTGPKSPLEDANITISSVSEVIMADLIKGSVTVGKYVFDGTVTLQNNTVLVNNGTIENNNSIVNNGTIDSYDGILSGTGTLTVNSGATLVMNANHNGGTDSKLPTMKTIVINAGGFLKSKTTNAESPADNTFIGTDNSARIILISGAITLGFQTAYGIGQHPTLTIAGNATIPSGMTWYSMYDSGKEAMGIDMTVNGTLTVSGTKSGENNAFVWNSGNELVADDGGKIVIDGIKVSNSGKITVNGLLEIYDGGKLYVGGEHGADTDCQCTLTVGKTGIIVNRGELTVAADGNFPKDSEKETSGKLFNAGMIINEGITNNRRTVAGDSVSEGTVSGPGTIFNKGTFVNGGILEYGKFENGSLFINDPDGTVKGKEDSVFFNDGMYVGKKPPVGRSFSDKGSGSENIQIAENIGYGGMNIKVAENSALKVIPINGISGILTAYFGDITVKIHISGGDSLTIAASKAAKPMSNGDPVYGISAAGSSKDMKKTVTVPWSGIGKPSVDRISGGKPAEHVRVIEYSSDSVTFETNGNSSYSVGSDSGPPPAYRDVKLTAGLGTKITCAEGDAFRITGSQTVYFTVLVFKTYTMKENIHSGNAEITHMGNGLYRMSDVVGNVNLTVSTVSEVDPEGTGNGSMNLALVAMAFSGVTLALIGFVAHMKKD